MTLISKTEQTVGEARSTVGVNDDDLQAGYNNVSSSTNVPGGFLSFPVGASLGSMKWFASNCSGNYAHTYTNAAFGQAVVFTVPDPVSSTASFLLNKGIQALASGASLSQDKGTGTESSNAVTINHQSGVITTTSLTTAAGLTEVITLTNSLISTTSVILMSVMGGTNTTPGLQIVVVPGSGSAVITITNTNASVAFNGTLILGFSVV